MSRSSDGENVSKRPTPLLCRGVAVAGEEYLQGCSLKFFI